MLDDQDKSLPPTALGLEKARGRGQVARSAELTLAAMLLGAWAMLTWSLPRLVDKLSTMLVAMLEVRWQAGRPILAGVWPAVAPVAMELGLLLAAMAAVAVLVNVLQVGLLATAEPICPDVSRIAPAEGLRRIFSLRSAQRLGMAAVKLAIVGWIVIAGIGSDTAMISRAAGRSVQELARCFGDVTSGVLLKTGLAMLALGLLDYVYQRWQHRRDLRISPRQLRQELKEMEGDSAQKKLRQRRARQSLSQQIQVEAPRAAVLISNDRDMALAIRLDSTMRQATVSAKASGPLGKRMMDLASRAGVCLVEDAPLAAALYRRCPARALVPRKYAGRVAEIVAYARQVSPGGGKAVRT